MVLVRRGCQLSCCSLPVLACLLVWGGTCNGRSLLLWPGSDSAEPSPSGPPQTSESLPGWQGDTYRPEEVFHKYQDTHADVTVISWQPRVFLFHNLITHEEADHIIALAKPFLQESLVSDDDTGELMATDERTSTSYFLNRSQDAVVSAIEERLARITYLPVGNQEPFEVLHYIKSQKNKEHYDWFHDKNSVTNGGNRVATALLYLSSTEKGGETAFFPPESEWSDKHCLSRAVSFVQPRKGNVLLFFDATPDGTPDQYSLHGACPVIKGDKWTATKWIRANDHDPDLGPPVTY